MPVELIKKGQAHSTVIKTDSGQVTTEATENYEVDPVAVAAGPFATITYSTGITKNLGGYESARVDVGISMPCSPDAQSIEDTYQAITEWVDEKCTEQVLELMNGQ